ncbi:hypothetical protein ACTMTI_56115 [Nonomuraea sp. H19]|uniref:hypothetical protein n=1 Tax=Nonomuraea sp. H19 TaxID=3452206 RepID=UPI003F8CB8AF
MSPSRTRPARLTGEFTQIALGFTREDFYQNAYLGCRQEAFDEPPSRSSGLAGLGAGDLDLLKEVAEHTHCKRRSIAESVRESGMQPGHR